MLVFIVPLQSPQASKNWHHVSRLLSRTLGSLLAQRHPDFKVVLVCNEMDYPSHSRLIIIRRDFPVPDSTTAGRMADKWNKVRCGLIAAREYAPCHVMVVDADDCVSNRLAGWCAEHLHHPGWYFDSGWMHDEGSRLIFHRRRDFDAVCGSSSIIRVMPDELPHDEGGEIDHIMLRSGHTRIRANMEARGTPLARLPFRGAVYNLATGENDSRFSLSGWRSKRVLIKKMLNYRLLTKRIRREFGLYDIARE